MMSTTITRLVRADSDHRATLGFDKLSHDHHEPDCSSSERATSRDRYAAAVSLLLRVLTSPYADNQAIEIRALGELR